MPANYVLLATQTVGNGGAASVTLSNIPQTGYTDLKIVASARSTRSSYADNFGLRFNGDTGNNYSYRRLYALGSGTPTGTSQTGVSTIVGGTLSADTATANTFGNAEFIIPNYTGSSYKSVSNDGTGENNATDSEIDLIAGIWNSTSAISSVTLYALSGNLAAGSTFYLYGIANVGTTPVTAPFASGGDVIANDGTYWYHAFKTTGAFVPAKSLSCDVLVVAGGGGGGFNLGGGGGAGGLIYATQAIPATSQTVTIGAGGAGGILGSGTKATNGVNSSIGSLVVASGGGAGGSSAEDNHSYQDGASGGSGGGGTGYYSNATNPGGAGISGQGYAGGSGTGDKVPPYGHASTGGGGGAGVAGTNGGSSSPWAGGAGGNGLYYDAFGVATLSGQYISSHYYFAGGGGGSGLSGSSQAAGGYGGGGLGGVDGGADSSVGTINTGGGGGGSRGNGTDGKAGGSGIVIIRYAMA